MTPQVCIAGWAHSPFGKHDALDVEDLIRLVAQPALDDAGVDAKQVDAIFLGTFNNGLSPQDFGASLVAMAVPALRHTPATRLENACATGSAALHAAMHYIESGAGRIALVLGVEKMTGVPNDKLIDVLRSGSYRKEEDRIDHGFAGVFGKIASEYFAENGDQRLALATIAAKNHRNGVNNPYAQFRRDLGVDFCNTVSERNPLVADPLRRTDCSLVSDGSAALVLVSGDVASTLNKAIKFRSTVQVNDFLPLSLRTGNYFGGAAMAWEKGLKEAGVGLFDLDLVETHDCFTIAEMLEYEAMGLTPRGKGWQAALDGTTAREGKLPVNPSGGLKSKGHPLGATGVSLHVMAAMQLMHDAGDMQIPDATLAGVFNMGGAAVTNYVSILERAR
jgi:acetyl-CoA C-acetyltransferase